MSIVHEIELNERIKALTKVVIAQAIAIEALTGLPATFEVTQSAEPMTFPNPFRTKSDSAEYQRLCQNFVQARAAVHDLITRRDLKNVTVVDKDYQFAAFALAEFVVGVNKAR